MRALVRLATASLLTLCLMACTDRDRLVDPTRAAGAATADIATLPPINRPIATKNPPPAPDQLMSITSGGDFTCARRYDSQVYCWGSDDVGQVGRSAPSSRYWCFVGVTNPTLPCVYQPTLVYRNGAPLLLKQVDAGENHACGLDAGGNAFCWGDGNLGQVGAVNGEMAVYQSPMAVTGGHTFGMISAGSRSTCATSVSGDAIYCWGKIYGLTGGPTLLTNDPRYRWSSIAVGEVHVCGIDVNGVYGALRCQGVNGSGQSGLPISSTSVTFDMGTTFPSWVTAVSTHSYTTCVDQTQNATIQCVGYNGWGQLGNGIYGSTGTAQTVGSGMVMRQVAVGDSHACALDGSKMAWCWGANFNGQLGNNSLTDSRTPVPVDGGRTYRSIAVGKAHTCAIGTDNVIYCWGNNRMGQLGSYFVTNPKIPNPTAALVQ